MARTKQTARATTSTSTSLAKSTSNTSSNKRASAPRPRKHHYPSKRDYDATSPLLRVHSSERNNPRGRVLHDWTLCVKPKSESNRGCRTGYMGYFVYHEGVLRRAVKCGTEVCDWEGGSEEAEEEVGGESKAEGDGEGAAGGQEIQEEVRDAMGIDEEGAPGNVDVKEKSSELEEGEIREDSSELEEGEIRE